MPRACAEVSELKAAGMFRQPDRKGPREAKGSTDNLSRRAVPYAHGERGQARRRRLPFTQSTPESHMAASKLMVSTADELYAVWDGKPARSYGGTADVVAYARERGIPVRVFGPTAHSATSGCADRPTAAP